MRASDNVITNDNVETGAKDTSVNIESIEGNVSLTAPSALSNERDLRDLIDRRTPAAYISYLETLKTVLVAVSICGTISLAWKYEAALTPALVVLGSAVGGYFGASTPGNTKR